MAELEKNYDPKLAEDRWYNEWETNKCFAGGVNPDGEPYTVVIPPPNVTGILHMGHALNNTIQDVLIRWQRMRGRDAVWVPGTDHAGIATQNVVERSLAKEGLTREDLGREKFLEKVWEWNDEYGATINRQLRKLGASCDWDREAFTMNENLSHAVRKVFVTLYDKDLIYRGNRIINWCPRCTTALSDEESEHENVKGNLYYIRYPIKGGRKKDYVVVATTRPETLLGDVAVAVNPRDERYKDLADKTVMLPILDRELLVIQDDFVDPEFGTGVVKVTPAHDPNDYEMGLRHELEQINILNENATMNAAAGPYEGMDRFDCRKKLLEDIEAAGLLDRIEEHDHAVGHCYRCNSVVEPYLSPQWFVKMKPLARPAVDVVKDGKVRFIPERWNKVYSEWMVNIRDWCISRQIWWGHRIPIFYCDACDHQWAALENPTSCSSCGSDQIRQDEDVLDTWFSSWLWPFSVFGWPDNNADLAKYYPTHALATASEIIFFWVARMIMAGQEFMGDVPFGDVYIHGTVRADDGRKMSKSLGNSIDPLDIIEKYSADALRFSLMILTSTGQDVYINDDKFQIGRNFGTKIWNAARFMQMQGLDVPADFEDPTFDPELLSTDDKHIIHSLQKSIRSCNDNLKKYRFNDYAKELYDFVWHKFCDWYVESSKHVFYDDNAPQEQKDQTLKVMHHVFSNALKLLHPVMPFITEELWSKMEYKVRSPYIMHATWPVSKKTEAMQELGIRPDVVDYVEAKHDLIRTARTLRSDYNLLAQKLEFNIKPSNQKMMDQMQADLPSITQFLKAEKINMTLDFSPSGVMPGAICRLGNIYMAIEGMVDIESEVGRLGSQLSKVQGDLEKISKKLANKNFVDRAPADVVEVQEKRKKDLLEKADKLNKLIESLKAA